MAMVSEKRYTLDNGTKMEYTAMLYLHTNHKIILRCAFKPNVPAKLINCYCKVECIYTAHLCIELWS